MPDGAGVDATLGAMVQPPLPAGIRRVTMPLPGRLGHVHSYLVPDEGGWMIVDTGLGLPDASERWATELTDIGRIARIFITHFHPDHVGAAADLHALTGASVFQGRDDYRQCHLLWSADPVELTERMTEWYAERAGVPSDLVPTLIGQGSFFAAFVRYAPDPELVDAGDELGGWRLVPAAGHADGQLMLYREGVLIGGDHILDPLTPTIGLWPNARPDPLGDYLEALARVIELEPEVVLPGHGDPIPEPASRAGELIAHHETRLERTLELLSAEPRSAYAVSLELFPDAVETGEQRLALSETLAHLERLVVTGGADRHEDVGPFAYTLA